MHQKHIYASVIVLGLIIAGMFAFAYMKKKEINEPAAPAPVTANEETGSPYSGITRIDAKHFFIGGTHTIVGEIPMPTPCDLLDWTTRMGTAPSQATVDFTVVNHAETCAQTVTPQRFKVSFQSAEDAVIKATLQGRGIEVNLIPAGPNETPDDFELFIKG